MPARPADAPANDRAAWKQLARRRFVDERDLRRDFNVMRYVAEDDFGKPETAFMICRFWLIDAKWEIGGPLLRRNVITSDAKPQQGLAESVGGGRSAERAQSADETQELTT